MISRRSVINNENNQGFLSSNYLPGYLLEEPYSSIWGTVGVEILNLKGL
jgi:hypothetical protein